MFNGEIYNFENIRNYLITKGFKFYTSSDTEVIIASYKYWKLDFVSKLKGMFAICIYDINNKKLILARDRSGEKPLYICAKDNFFSFTSELKSFLWHNHFSKKLQLEA